MAEHNKFRVKYSVSISELRKAPMKVIQSAVGGPVVLLNQNAPVAYMLSPKMMSNLLGLVADKLVERRAQERLPTLKEARAVSLSDL